MNSEKSNRRLLLLTVCVGACTCIIHMLATLATVYSAEASQQPQDTLPPSTNVQPLPSYTRNDVVVSWLGDDDESGVDYYDIQYRIGKDGYWQDWLLRTWQLNSTFGKIPGKTVYFRSRGTDKRGNVEPWPAGDGDTQTTFYNWAIEGVTLDNRLVPVSAVAISSTQEFFEVNPSNEEGLFSAYSDGYDASYQVDLFKPGYGSLPTGSYSALEDVYMDVLLPPADSIVADPGFEPSATLAQSWKAGGLLAPEIVTASHHSGDQSVLLGTHYGLEKISQFDADPIFSYGQVPKEDAFGHFHLAWYLGSYDDKEIFYSSGDNNGNWSAPVSVTPFPSNITKLLWDIGSDGTVHIVWTANMGTFTNVYHMWKDNTGWHGPSIVYNIGYAQLYSFRVDSENGGHLLWRLEGTSFDDSYYSYVNPHGVWSSPDRLFVGYDTEVYNLVLDKENAVHLQWNYSGDQLLHSYRKSDGSWSDHELVAPGDYNWYNDLVIDDNNGVHLVWGKTWGIIYHSKRQPDGSWSLPTVVSEGTEAESATLKVAAGPGGTLVIAWTGGSRPCRTPYVALIDQDGKWLETRKLELGGVCVGDIWFARAGENLFLHTNYRFEDTNSFCYLPFGEQVSNLIGECTALQVEQYGSEKPYPLIGQDGLSHVFWRVRGNDFQTDLLHSRTQIFRSAADSRLWQVVELPRELQEPTLSFAVWQRNPILRGSSELQVRIDSGVDSSITTASAGTSGWGYEWIDVGAWSGETITVTFELVQEVGNRGNWAYVDEVYLGSAHPNTWVDIEVQGDVFPAATITLEISFGNRSTVEAAGTELTLYLSPGLTFLESSPMPVVQNRTLTWDLGSLTEGNSDAGISARVAVSESIGVGTSLPVSVSLDTDTKELDLDNNSMETALLVKKAMEADFNASPKTGVAPLEVFFTNRSIGDYAQCVWDFGDGGTAVDCDGVSHEYTLHGVYSVTLGISGQYGEDVLTELDYITVYEPVMADFDVAPRNGVAPLTVDFQNLSSGDFEKCAWDFGDGASSEECGSPKHVYERAGTYSITLEVSGPGGSDLGTKSDYIQVHEPVRADFEAFPKSGPPPLEVVFTNLSVGDFSECLWDFGDGVTSTTCDNPRHNYEGEDQYSVSLTVQGLGGKDTVTVKKCVTVFYYRLYLPGILDAE